MITTSQPFFLTPHPIPVHSIAIPASASNHRIIDPSPIKATLPLLPRWEQLFNGGDFIFWQ